MSPLPLLRSVLVLVLALVGISTAFSGTVDTLRRYDPRSAHAFYQDRTIVAQSARFDLAAPARVRELTIWLTGPAGATAEVVLADGIDALPAPIRDQRLNEPIVIRKKLDGAEGVLLILPEPVFVGSPQFFVIVEDLTGGARLLTDQRPKRAVCSDGVESWLFQSVRKSDGAWYHGRYGFAIDVVVEYPEEEAPSWLVDVRPEAGFLEESSRNRSIAWGDADGDEDLDVLVGGRLYLNRGEDRFELAKQIVHPIAPAGQIFIDVDSDGDLDVLSAGFPDSSSRLAINDGRGRFTDAVVSIPEVVRLSALALADVDSDGDVDAFVGQGVDTRGDVLPSFVLMNRGDGRFDARPLGDGNAVLPESRLRPGSGEATESAPEGGAGITGAQWIDADRDGDPDLHTTADRPTDNLLWINDGTGNLSPAESTTSAAQHDRSGLADWGDANADGAPDLLQPISLSADRLASDPARSDLLPVRDREEFVPQLSYLHWSAGGVWGDVDNDGSLDALLTSACNCRSAALFTRAPDGRFVDGTFEYGLSRLPAGADGVWVDYNDDGKLDLATFVGDRFVLLKNTLNSAGAFVEVDLEGGGGMAGLFAGRVTVHAGAQRITRDVVSGRGSLMQAPLRFHFGLGDVRRIDSVTIDPAGGLDRVVLRNPEQNSILRPFDEATSHPLEAEWTLRASPNPFTSALDLTFTITERMPVSIAIWSADGKALGTLIDAELDAGSHAVRWEALDRNGAPLPPGVYVYRARFGTEMVTGRATLIR